MKNDHRPDNLDPSNILFGFAWPLAALASITHRISGVILLVAIGFGLYALDLSLSSEQGFESISGLINTPLGMFITWGCLAALAYHFVAGIKHLLLDFGYGESLAGAKRGAQITFTLATILILLAGFWVTQG